MRSNKETKMRIGKRRFVNHPARTGKKLYHKLYIYIPTEVARDGAFPFKVGDEVSTKIENNKSIAEKTKTE